MYKLTRSGSIIRLSSGVSFVPDERNADYQDYLAWLALGNTPQPADPLPPAEAAQLEEMLQSRVIVRQYFVSHQAAIDFMRLSPAQQEAQINAMTLAQLKVVLTYLAIAVSALVKREFL